MKDATGLDFDAGLFDEIRRQRSLIRPTIIRSDFVTEDVLVIFPKFLARAYIEEYAPDFVMRFKVNETALYRMGDVTIAAPVFGAPSVSFVLENLINCGARRFVSVGTAGVLKEGSSPGLAFVDSCHDYTGVSPFYLKGRSLRLDSEFAQSVRGLMTGHFPQMTSGSCFSIDTPYRETPALIKALYEAGVDFIDMESAAFNSIATALGAEAASLLLISDEVAVKGGNWKTYFKSRSFKEEMAKLLDLLSAPKGLFAY